MKSSLKKNFEIAKRLRNFFSKVHLGLFSSSAPQKIFESCQTFSKKFFQRCTQDYFHNIHLEKGLKQPNDFKRIFLKVHS